MFIRKERNSGSDEMADCEHDKCSYCGESHKTKTCPDFIMDNVVLNDETKDDTIGGLCRNIAEFVDNESDEIKSARDAEWLKAIDDLLIELDEWEENPEDSGLLVRSDKVPYVLETGKESRDYFVKSLECVKFKMSEVTGEKA